jgi:predicted enzyme related to lactoylglutathione lyase
MPVSESHVINGISHFDVAGPDISVLGVFYSAVFGWSVEGKGPGYALVKTPDGSANGALVESEVSALTLGIVVTDIAEATTRAQRHGGAITMPVTDNGWVKKAQVTDPAGNILTLIQG